jgi:membrane-associated phospholipid phosphatase
VDELFVTLSSLPLRLALLGFGAAVVCWIARSVLPALAAAVAIPVAFGLTVALKDIVDRPRPTGTDPVVPLPDSPAFPSGHAATAFAAAVALAAFTHRTLWLPLLAVAGLVGYSRIWLGVHHVSDVIGGAALGAAVAVVAVWLVRLRNRAHVATVDLDGRTGDVGGGGREQKRGDATEFDGLAVAAERDRGGVARADLVGRDPGGFGAGAVEETHSLGVDPARRQRVHADRGPELKRKALDERGDTGSEDVRRVQPRDRNPYRRRGDEQDRGALPQEWSK